ncbi:hypothetical protein BDW22DRAFT_1182296 [Trametopsis cervina]|nr:hypothetical protein BDW22DRAFT_1182296 [Trametopsis cervina]
MQTAIRRLRQFQLALSRRHESLQLQGITHSLDAYKPLYERTPPWSARWTYPIIFAQIGVSCALTELIMNHWTELKTPDSPKLVGSIGEQAADGEVAPPPEYVLRPIWQRAPAVLGQFCVSAFICILLLNSRAGIVRRLYLLPSSALTPTPLTPPLSTLQIIQASPSLSSPKHKSKHARATQDVEDPEVKTQLWITHKVDEKKLLVVQNVYHFRGQGVILPFTHTRLTQGYDNRPGSEELALEVGGRRTKFYLGLPGATVNGETFTKDGKSDVWRTREALYRVWYGKNAQKEMSKFGWVS